VTFALAYVVTKAFLGWQQSRDTTLPPLLIPGVATLDIAVTGYAMPFPWAHEMNKLAFAICSVIAAVFVSLMASRQSGRPIRAAQDFIADNLAADLSVAAIAMRERNFSKQFKQEVGRRLQVRDRKRTIRFEKQIG